MEASFADSTILRYKAIWSKFRGFAAHDPDWSFPAPPRLLAKYGVWLSQEGYKPATVATHLAGIGWWHRVRDLQDPSASYLVKRMLLGLGKSGPKPKQAFPLRQSAMAGLLAQLRRRHSEYDRSLYSAAFLLAYFASLRVGEYSTPGNHTLHLKSVGFIRDKGEQCILLTLGTFKASKRPAKALVPPEPEAAGCPVAALKAYLRVRPPGEGPLFLISSGLPMTSKDVNATLKACVAAMGLNPADYSSHSFRAGRTTDYVEMGLEDAVIRESGRWKTDAFLKYIRFDVFRLPQGVPE